MRRALILAVITVVLAAITIEPAQAIGFGPRLGYYRANGADSGEFMYGAALRAKPLPFLGVEGSVDYRQEKFGDDVLTVRSWPVMVTGLVYPLPVLYGALGAGWYHTTFDYNSANDDTQSEFGWHLGGGVEIPLPIGAVAADIRYVFLDMKFKELPEVPERDSNFYVMTVGLLFGL